MSTNSKLGDIASSFLNAINDYPDPATFTLIKAAVANSPSPKTVEVAWQLLGAWTGNGLDIPTPIPPSPAISFPKDHGEHWDTPIEWRYITLSLNLAGGGVVSVIANFFRKAIATKAGAPGVNDVERQIYSTSIGVTLQMPGAAPVHYALPTTTFAPVEGGVTIGNDPFRMMVGKNSLVGTSDVFPLHAHIEDAGDAAAGRPAIVVDVDCAATNPLFLQGESGYVGPPVQAGKKIPSVGWYYYSWPQQAVTGKVSMAGKTYDVASGRAWMDHQWGGAPPPSPAVMPAWSGWCWFEFQFDGDRSLTLACPHGPIVGGKLPLINPGFGTYIERGKSTLVAAALEVGSYTKSVETDALYPCTWTIEVGTKDGPIFLVVKPTTVVENQALWMGSLAEYSESAATVMALGLVGGKPVHMTGVGFCEGVGFEDPDESRTRGRTWLRAKLEKST